jgi:zinc transporter
MADKLKVLVFDGKGGASPDSSAQLDHFSGVTWARLTSTSVKTFLKKIPDVPPLVERFLCKLETRPRTIFQDDSLLASYRGVNLNKGEAPEDMIAVRLWIRGNLIVTVQHRRLRTTNKIETSLQQGVGPKTAGAFLGILLYELTDNTSQVVSNLSDLLDVIEEAGEKDEVQKTNYESLSDVRRRIIFLHRYLTPQNEAINQLFTDKLSWLTPEVMGKLLEVSDVNKRLLEDLQAERERAVVIQEEFFSLAQQRLNQKMYILAIVSVIFIPLTFITGLLGVNLSGIPGADMNFAFLGLCVFLIIMFLVQLRHLKKNKWL